MKYKKLFEKYHIGNIELSNRFVMAPMTRSRSTPPCNIPNDLMALYYSQRASAGLIISEATQISLQGQGYANTPGIYTKEQTEGWKKVVQSVHGKGSKFFLQLWHVGRVSSSKVNGLQPLAPSARAAKETRVYIFDGAPNGDATMIDVEEPKAMSLSDIRATIKDYSAAARNAAEAGFDGVEVHAANGYLIDQFLRGNSNVRTDEYGGSKEKRIRFLTEAVEAVIAAVGKEKVGVRLSPFIKFKDMDDPEILDTILLAAEKLNKLGVAYIHLCEADWDDAPQIPQSFRIQLRKIYSGTIIATGNKTPDSAELLLQQGLVDLVGFGRAVLANPDYVERVKNNFPLNVIEDTHTLFGGGGAKGYTDYPLYKTTK